MKRMFAILLSAALLLSLLPGCSVSCPASPTEAPSPAPVSEPTSEPSDDLPTADQLLEAVLLSCEGELGATERLTPADDRERLSAYLENAYGLAEGQWEDAAVLRATWASAFELAVLRLPDDDAAVRAAASLMSYLSARQGDFTGYAPDQADMVANGGIRQTGPWLALFICPDTGGADDAFRAALSGQVPAPEPSESPAGPITGVKELRDFLVSHHGMDGAELEKLDNSDMGALSVYMMRTYGLSPNQWRECAIARGSGDTAFEVAVIRSDGMADSVAETLNVYLNEREAQFDPSSDNGKLFGQAITMQSTNFVVNYVVMLVCPDVEDTAQAFANAIGSLRYNRCPRFRADPDYPDRCKFIPPNYMDMSVYDTSAILTAWAEGDPSALSKHDRDIYDEAQEMLEETLQDGMSDYEKEVAVYSWMLQNIGYDWTLQNDIQETSRESFAPYGGLVNHSAVCLGYATTFQLLMDMAGVECITVVGAAHRNASHHAWNMVRLKGEWYCVDATWDLDTGDRPEDWCHFNVTSDYMAATDHQWDYANTPEATAEDYGQG